MASLPSNIIVEVRCIRLPAACAGEAVYLGIQRDRDVVNIVPASVGKAVFTPDFRLTDFDGEPNFHGPYAQGPRDERFFYLSWGRGGSASTFQMFRRLKVHLSHLTWKHIKGATRRGEPLRVTIDMTDRCGRAASCLCLGGPPSGFLGSELSAGRLKRRCRGNSRGTSRLPRSPMPNHDPARSADARDHPVQHHFCAGAQGGFFRPHATRLRQSLAGDPRRYRCDLARGCQRAAAFAFSQRDIISHQTSKSVGIAVQSSLNPGHTCSSSS